MTRGWMARRLLEKRYATAMTTTRPRRPVKRSMRSLRLTYDFENEFAALRRSRSDAESIFDELRGFVDIIFASIVETAQHAAGVNLLAHFHFQDHADGGIDRIFLGIAAGADHGRGLADVFGVNGADVARARRTDFARPGGVGQELETVENMRVAALRRDHFFQLAIARPVEQFLLRDLAGFVKRSRLL